MVFAMLRYLRDNQLDFDSILTTLNFKKIRIEEIEARIPFLREKYKEIATSTDPGAETRWIMGELRKTATGNIKLPDLKIQCCN